MHIYLQILQELEISMNIRKLLSKNRYKIGILDVPPDIVDLIIRNDDNNCNEPSVLTKLSKSNNKRRSCPVFLIGVVLCARRKAKLHFFLNEIKERDY